MLEAAGGGGVGGGMDPEAEKRMREEYEAQMRQN